MIIPLFPLDLVLFPHGLLPLHIFEERYKKMIGQCVSGDVSFGIAYATAGKTVGGTATTVSIGVTAQIEQHRLLADGRYLILVSGDKRFHITKRVDAQFPQADVEIMSPDQGEDFSFINFSPETFTNTKERENKYVYQFERRMRRYIGLAAEAGEIDTYIPPQFDADLETVSFLAANMLPINMQHRQELLEMSTAERLQAIEEKIAQDDSRLERMITER